MLGQLNKQCAKIYKIIEGLCLASPFKDLHLLLYAIFLFPVCFQITLFRAEPF